MNATTALTPVVVPTDKGTLLPVFTGAEMAAALTAYRELQHALDAAMPDQIINLDGKPFRKNGYWRVGSVAVRLSAMRSR